jgi:hypothetical protein
MKIVNEMTWRVKREENLGEERAALSASSQEGFEAWQAEVLDGAEVSDSTE